MKRYLLIATLLTSPVFADHGRDFLLLQDATVPAIGDWITFTNFNASVQSGPDEAGFELGATTGIFPRTSLTAALQSADSGQGSWDWSSAGPALQFDLTPPGSPVLIGLLIGRDFALRDQHYDHEDHHEDDAHDDHHEEDDHHDFEVLHADDPHEEEEPHEHEDEEGGNHEHSGIHLHGIDAYHARLIIEGTVCGETRWVGNLIALFPDEGETAFGYAVGIRHPVSDRLAIGAEATGDFSINDYHEATLGCYYSPIHALTLKAGLGFGLNSASPDFTFRTGLVWKF